MSRGSRRQTYYSDREFKERARKLINPISSRNDLLPRSQSLEPVWSRSDAESFFDSLAPSEDSPTRWLDRVPSGSRPPPDPRDVYAGSRPPVFPYGPRPRPSLRGPAQYAAMRLLRMLIPLRVRFCVSRNQRREVLFAKRLAGYSGSARKRHWYRNQNSQYSCR